MQKYISKIIVDSIEDFDNPPKHTFKYLLMSIASSFVFALFTVLSIIFANLDFFDNLVAMLWLNLLMYKSVIVYLLFSILYIYFFILRSNGNVFLFALLLKGFTTAFMVNYLIITLSKALIDFGFLSDEKWKILLPYNGSYPFSPMIILFSVWWVTWYAALHQRKRLKNENTDYRDVCDLVKDWLKQKYA